MSDVQDKASFIWSAAGKLWHDYKPCEYQKVILPLTVIRRLDCVLAPTKDKVLEAYEKAKKAKSKNFEPLLDRGIGVQFPLVCGASRDRWSVVPETFSRGAAL